MSRQTRDLMPRTVPAKLVTYFITAAAPIRSNKGKVTVTAA
jgi:hypothetical protein